MRKVRKTLGGLVNGTVTIVSNLGKVHQAMEDAYRKAAQFQAVDTYGEANRMMGYKRSRTTGKATSGGESKRKPKRPGQTVTGRARHDEFGLHKFAYVWKNKKELRVGPLSRGGVGDLGMIHNGGRGKTRFIYKDKFLYDKKKRGRGRKKTVNKNKAAKYWKTTSPFAYRHGEISKLGYVVYGRKALHNNDRYEFVGSTNQAKSRPYLEIAANRMAPKFQKKLDREQTKAMKKVKTRGR